MSSPFLDGMATLAALMADSMETIVTYRRGAQVFTAVPAVLGRQLLKVNDARGQTKTQQTDRDVGIRRAVFPAALVQPQDNDFIDVTLGGETRRYCVLPYDSEPAWRLSQDGLWFRIHGKDRGAV